METLDQIGLRYATDKASDRNDFLTFYEPFLASMRMRAKRVLEIGVLKGASVRMWRDYFPNAEIIGVDINRVCTQYAGERLRIEIANQSSAVDLDRLAALGPFDLVVDDGTHGWPHQILTFRKLMPAVADSGCFIIEDLDTSYGSFVPVHCLGGDISPAEYLKRVCDRVVGRRVMDAVEQLDADILSIAKRIDTMSFARGTSLVQLQGPHSRIDRLTLR